MKLEEIRAEAQERLDAYHRRLSEMDDSNIQHFQQEHAGPLTNVTHAIRDEYRRHIETYTAFIAQIDAILGA
jgi:hypothetical protein